MHIQGFEQGIEIAAVLEKEDTTTSGTWSCARRSPSPMHPPPHALEKKSATRLLVTELLARGSKTGARVNQP